MYCFNFVFSYASDVSILFLKLSKILCLIFFNKLITDTVPAIDKPCIRILLKVLKKTF